jgi:hypothetical protein
MTVYKRANSDIVFDNKVNPLANTVVSTHTLFVDGNLLVGGNSSVITKTDLAITDNMIILNRGEVGAGVSLIYSGIEIDRGSLSNVQLRFNEINDRWQITSDGITFANILVDSGIGSVNIEFDPFPTLGGELQTNAYPIVSGNSYPVTFDSNVAIKNVVTAPDTLAGYNILYTQAPNSGGSGLYVTNTTIQNQELSTQRRNIVYSLVL